MRLPLNQYIADVIKKNWWGEILKKVRKFESLGYHVRKCELHIKFLDICHYLNVTQTLRFYVTNKKLRNSETHSKCHHLHLSKVILSQKRRLRQIKLEHDSIK